MRLPRNFFLFPLIVLFCLTLLNSGYSLTVEKTSLEKLTRGSHLIIHGTVVSTVSRWEGRTINSYITVRIVDLVKGEATGYVTVKQFGGTVGDISDEVTGTPKLTRNKEVLLFLVEWKGHFWIHSIVLGSFSIFDEGGTAVAVNDLNNVGLIDPLTRREVTDSAGKVNAFPLDAFKASIRKLVKESRQ